MAGKICLRTFKSIHWIVYSGATNHMCHDLSLLSQFSTIQDLETYITLQSGKKALVSLKESVQIIDNIILKDVLYVS